jgi:hypothetical protein
LDDGTSLCVQGKADTSASGLMVWMAAAETDRNTFLNLRKYLFAAWLMKKGVFYRIVNAVYQKSIDFNNKV